ncbi:MAG: hypothetical protein QXG32_05665 [Candidatus Bathyarchaeia archaeon]
MSRLEEEFRLDMGYVSPVVLSLCATGLLSSLIYYSKIEMEPITIFEETPGGAALNTLYFVAILAGSATMLYLLLKYGLSKLVKYSMRIAVALVALFVSDWSVGLCLRVLWPGAEPNKAIVALPIAAALVYGSLGGSERLRAASIALLGAMTGTFLGSSIPLLTSIALLLALAAYDMVAVFRGPIGKIAEIFPLEEFPGATLTYHGVTIGMGDVVFYSMLAGGAMVNFGPLHYLLSSLGLIAGLFAGLRMLSRRSIFPGLPLAILLGLLMMGVSEALRALLSI